MRLLVHFPAGAARPRPVAIPGERLSRGQLTNTLILVCVPPARQGGGARGALLLTAAPAPGITPRTSQALRLSPQRHERAETIHRGPPLPPRSRRPAGRVRRPGRGPAQPTRRAPPAR